MALLNFIRSLREAERELIVGTELLSEMEESVR
jgi:hypothetical protein